MEISQIHGREKDKYNKEKQHSNIRGSRKNNNTLQLGTKIH
jgi:hypothetical protein